MRATRLLVLISVCGLMLLLATQAAFGQQSPTGLDQFGTFHRNQIQTMNLFNLNNHIEIPLFTKKERGVNFYAKLIWDQSDALAFVQVPYPPGGSYFQVNGGPRLETVTDVGYNSHATGSQTCNSAFQNQAVIYYFDSIVDQSNTVHPMPYNTSVETGPGCSAGTYSVASNDGQWLLTVIYTNQNCSGQQCITSVTETDTSGNVFGGPPGSTITLTDPNGNQITKSTPTPGNSTWIDPTGNTVFTAQEPSPPPYIFSYHIQTGGMANFQLNYTSGFTFQNNFGCNLPYTNTSGSLPTSISLPDGTSYSFVYESANGSYPSTTVTGRIHSITVPAGGTWTYTYSGGNNGINCTGTPGSPATITITGSDGSAWTYNNTVCTSNCSTSPWSQTVVTDAACNDSIYSFDALGHQMQAQSYQGTAGTAACSATTKTLLQTVTTCYNGDFANCGTLPSTGSCTIVNGICRTDAYTYLPGLSQPSLSEIFYNSSELPTQDNEFDFGVNTGSAPTTTPLRSTMTTYANIGSNILNRPSCVEVTGGTSPSTCGTVAGTTKSITNYLNYDSHGNVGQIQNWVSGSTYLSKNFTYYSTGLLNIETDVNGAQTSYTYGACNSSYPTLNNEPLSLSKSMTWDCNGGVVTSVTDANSQKTSYSYNDPFWRVTAITDPLNNITTLNYTPTTAESTLTFNGGSSAEDILETVDAFGRIKARQTRQAPGSSLFDTVSYSYDLNGRLATVSVPCVSTAGTGCAASRTSTTYDPLSRPTSVTDGVGGTTAYTYSENDVLITLSPAPSGENTKRHQFEYDALARLTSVCEITSGTTAWPGASCGQNTSAIGYLTKYTFDALGNLLTVTQNAQSSSNQQTRSYAFDAMSRLTSETNAESGTTTYVYDSDSTCGTSTGDPVKKSDGAGNVTCTAYDALHRPTTITYPSGPNSSSTAMKVFYYDASHFNTTYNTKGRLASAGTCANPTCAGPWITAEDFSYSGRGEVTDVYEWTTNSGGWYHVSQTYWPHGLPAQLGGLPGLPTINYGGTAGLDGEGRITQVTAGSGQNPVTGVTYNVASLPTQVTLGSGDSDIFAYDSNTMRMTQYKFNVGKKTKSLIGSLTWNANGSLGKQVITDAFNSANTQTCNYSHDDLIRMASANCGAAASQTFSYDPFGNISKSGSPYTFQPTYNSSTNRFATLPGTTPSYDANGNVLSDGSHTYAWDANGNSVSVDTVGLTFDALDRMVEQNRSGGYTQIVYSPTGGKLALLNGQTLQKAFVPLPGQAAAVYTSSGLGYYRHSDWLGSARLTSSPSRSYISSVAYAPFGETYAQSGTPDISFTGENPDTVSSDYDFLAREYSTQGRWLSPDPAGLDAVDTSNPQSWDRYSYVSNNALTRTDPDGLGDCPDQDPFTCTVTTSTDYVPVTSFSWRVLWQTLGNASQKANDYLHAAYQAVVNSRIACTASYVAAGALAGGVVGAETGALAGGGGGAALGLAGGPAAPVTVPIGAGGGATLGTAIGGGAGAIGGGTAGFYAGQALCASGTGSGGGSGTSSSAKPGKIKGFTKHGLNQAISRDGHGVSTAAIKDAVENPVSITKQANATVYTGKDAVVVLNNGGRVVTTYATNAAGWRF